MPLHLYRDTWWWLRGVGGVRLKAGLHDDLASEDEAALIALRRATNHPTPHSGEAMFNDTCTDSSDSLRLITPPASEPLTLAETKSFLRIEHDADDDAITRAIAAAREAAEQYLRAPLLPQTWEYTLANPCRAEVRLTFGPAQSITSVTVTDSSGATSTIDSAHYRLSVDGGMVIFLNRMTSSKLAIRYSASIAADADAVPALIKQGMLHHVAAMMEQREGLAPLPMQSIACYLPYRKISL